MNNKQRSSIFLELFLLLSLLTFVGGCKPDWHKGAEGIFDHAEYVPGSVGLFAGDGDPGKTVIYFEDGSSALVWYQRNINIKKGTCIAVWYDYSAGNRSALILSCGIDPRGDKTFDRHY